MTESNFSLERYNSEFAVKLRDEFLKTPDDVKGLAKYLGCSIQAINQYKQGQALPKVENLIKIAQYFDCSLDYLIGLSDVKTPNADIQSICNYSGLSEESLKQLHYHKVLSPGNMYSSAVLDGINLLAEDKELGNEVLKYISEYVKNDYSGFRVPGAEDHKHYSHMELWNGETYLHDVAVWEIKAGIVVIIQGLLQKLRDKVKGDKNHGKQ